jgi:hypothetical protein
MATGRIESGQISLRPAGGVPMQQIGMQQTDYGAQFRQEAQGQNALAQLVDRMSQSSMQMAGEFFKEQAMIDVANSPLTPAQLEMAKNGDMSFLEGGSRLNLYDATLRKARSMELASAFDTEAKAKVVEIQADVEAGTLNSKQAAEKLNTMASGFAKSLAQVDADAALRFTASMGVYSKTVMAEAYKLEVKRNKEKAGLALDADYTNTMKLVEPAIGQGFLVDAAGKEVPIDNILAVHRKSFVDKAFVAGGLQMAQQYGERFDKAVAEAKVNAATKIALGDAYMADTVIGYNKLRSGDLGRMSAVFMEMPQDDKDKVVKNFMTAVSYREKVNKEAQDEKDRQALTEFIPVYNQVMSLPEGNAKRKQLIGQIAKMAEANPKMVPLGVLADLQKPSTEGNSMVEFNALAQIYDGRITSAEQIYQLPGLNGKQKVNLLGKLVSEDRRNDSELDRGISRLAGIPVIPGQMVVIDPKGKEWERRLTLSAQATEIKAKAMAEGKVLTNNDVIRQLEAGIEQSRNTEAAKAARTKLQNYEKSEWINGRITRDSLPALERKAGTDKRRVNELNDIKRLLDKADGGN